ncbi:MAG: terminase small subunit [bacterium]
MENEDKLTERQRRFVDNFVDTGNATESARLAGYSEKSANEIGYENLKKPVVRAAICVRMDQARITEPRLLKVLDEGLNAHVVKVFHHNGTVIESKEYPDYSIRHQYLETALKLRDMFPSQKVDITFNVFEGRSAEELEYFAAYGEWPELLDMP